ncbi:MAG TPA: 2Fe-2S iron-sulfur cluster-binding protein [Actinocrinis sp.]|jgi:aerobic-type carbon monoxide dehydrogenase small subunit (CoxS/CutS family)|uniref:(2Fe-2S)-binding protein n=1 Tax=Actinocrinis sp. TaxID=1920516 RepID=UPI002DDCD2CC|nr:2Fe-2S iron-sulfur cluster-binding protein [Actinocrinis sp.]HEV3173300.1 2Fe-2S iron-sulfur cluster-binding protein [Actinocrinis sp.]
MTAGEPWPAADVAGEAETEDTAALDFAPTDFVAADFAAVDFATVDFELAVNGTAQPVAGAWIGESLLFALRERLGLVAAKDGCGEGECGACTVLMDGQPTAACLVPAVAAVGRDVRTPEIYAVPRPDAVAAALAVHAGTGCGYCLPGVGMELRALLARNPKPSAPAVREALSGHRCRCLPAECFVDAIGEVVAQLPEPRKPEQPGPQLPAQKTRPAPAPPAPPAAAQRLDESGSWSWQTAAGASEAADRP